MACLLGVNRGVVVGVPSWWESQFTPPTPTASPSWSNLLFPSPPVRKPNSIKFPLRLRSPAAIRSASCADFLRYRVPDEIIKHVDEGRVTCPLVWRKEDVSLIFEAWCKERGKTYASHEEKMHRLKVFSYNHELIQNRHDYLDPKLCFGVKTVHNGFADLTYDECQTRLFPAAKWTEEETAVIPCDTIDAQFYLLVWSEFVLTVVAFTAKWCPPCEFMDQLLEELSLTKPLVSFLTVDMIVDELKRFAADKWQVEAVPTIFFLKKGQLVDKVVGAVPDEFYRKFCKFASVH